MHRLKNDSSDVMSCLIKHKNDEEMKLHYKCRAAVEHFQLISLNDYHFTVTFKNACRPYVLHYCPKAHTKAQVGYLALNVSPRKYLLTVFCFATGCRMLERGYSERYVER